MRLEELKEAAYHGNSPQLERLLDAVAEVMPFVGYESMGAERLKDELNTAFKEITGHDWYHWKNDERS